MQETRRRILDILKERGHATVEELAQGTGLKAITIRHHLAVLESAGLVAHEKVRRKVGRPHLAYSLTNKADEYFPKGYHLLVDRLLERLKAVEGQERVQQIMQEIADKMATQLGQAVPAGTWEERLDQVAKLMAEEGFLLTWEKTADGYIVRECNCPYPQTAQHHGEVCAWDLALLEKVLGVKLERTSHMAHGGDRCTYTVLPPT